MKTNKFIAVAFATLFIAAFNACTKEETPAAPEVPGVEENLVELTFTATQYVDQAEAEQASVAVKSTFDGTQVGWEADDLVAIYDGTAKRQFTVASVENGVATLTGKVAAGSTEFYAVFPYSAAADALPTAEGQVSLNLPAVQTLAEGKNFDEDAFVTVGKVQDGNVVLKNAVSVLKLNIPEGVSSVRLQGFAYESISGGVYASSDAVAGQGEVSSVTLKPSGETFAAGEHYIALLPTKFTAGFKVVYSQEGKIAVVKKTSAVEFPRNGGFDITGSTANLTWLANPIMTEADLRAYFANQDAFAGETVKLGQNITLASAWTPVTLTGMFDGQNYTISGVNVSAKENVGFFSVVKSGASVKNLTIEGAIHAEAPTYAARNYVGVAGQVNGGTMTNVVNKATISTATDGKYSLQVGGIAGALTAGGTILNCENRANVTANGSGDAICVVGGIVGYVGSTGNNTSEKGGTISGCKNYGTIVSNNDKVEALGGIVGMLRGGKVDGCINEETALVKADVSAGCYIGGCVGYIQNRSGLALKVSACENKGTLQSNTSKVIGVGGVAGELHMWQNGDTEIADCYNRTAITVKAIVADGWLGGVVGRMSSSDTKTATIKSCHNTAALTLDCSTITAGKVGGIAGATVSNVVIQNCDNSGACTLLGSKTTGNTSHVGGIVGRAEGKLVMSGNINKEGADVKLEVKSLASNAAGSTCSAGGVVGLSQCSSGSSMSGNVNKADVTTACSGTQVMAGGVVGVVQSHLAMSDNINFGDVAMTGATGDIFAGGIVGAFNMHGKADATDNPVVSLLRDKSFGAISSEARSGLLFGAYAWDCYGKTTIDECVVGGSRQQGTGAATVITSANFASHLWSWTRSGAVGSTLIQKNTIFGMASDYDK